MTEEQEDTTSNKGGREPVEPQPGGDMSRNWVDQFYEELNHALRRFNYFLVAISFMFVAFVTLITSSKSNELDWIIKAVGIAGALLSLYFFQINYQQTRVADVVRDNRLRTPVDKEEQHTYFRTCRWMGESLLDAILYLPRFRFIARERPASHTWIVPVLFLLLWVFSLVWWW